MVDPPIVLCCMCGDLGFPDKLFLCPRCKTRFQHSYCSNYYGESKRQQICDWCIYKEKNSSTGVGGGSSSSFSLKKQSSGGGRESSAVGVARRSEYSGEKIKNQTGGEDKGKNPVASPRPSARRYKLLKDVMC